jgi:hypothetical protein
MILQMQLTLVIENFLQLVRSRHTFFHCLVTVKVLSNKHNSWHNCFSGSVGLNNNPDINGTPNILVLQSWTLSFVLLRVIRISGLKTASVVQEFYEKSNIPNNQI